MAQLSEYQRDALARMVVGGVPRQQIARALGISPATVDRHVKEDDQTKAAIDTVRAQELRVLAVHHTEMLDMLEDARSAIREGIHARDERLRVETARWLIERTTPKIETQEVHLSVEGQVNHELSGTLKSILGHVVQIQAAAGGTFERHVRSGPGALPGVTMLPQPPPEELLELPDEVLADELETVADA